MGHSDTHRMLHGYFNSRQFDAILPHLAPGFMCEDLPRVLTMKSGEEFIAYLTDWVTGFSDAEIGSVQYFDGADHSVALFHARGTNDGPGNFPPTGRTMDVPFCEVLHYAADGSVLSSEIYYDQMTLALQLGLLPPMEQQGASARVDLDAEATVREVFARFDRMQKSEMLALFADDAQGIDEIARDWIRDRDALEGYLDQLVGSVSDVSSELRDLHVVEYGDVAIATCWLEQDYSVDGVAEHVTAPTTVGLRRGPEGWQVCLIHTVPLGESPSTG